MAVAVAPRPLCHNRHCAVKGKSLYSQVPPALAASPRRRAAPSLQTRLPRPQADVRSLESRNLLSQGSGLSDRHTQPGGIDGRVAGARGPSKLHAVASYPAANAAYAPVPAEEASTKKPFIHVVRAFFFWLSTLIIVIPVFVAMVIMHPFVLLFDKLRRRAHHKANDVWANISTSLFHKTVVEGRENLPASDEAAVYVANHQSQLDIYTLFHIHRPFKFISKTSIFLIPIFGWCMYLTGHVPLKREDKRSQMECLKQCLSLLQSGVPVLFFPEGTRSKNGEMKSFKKGAFSVAAKAGVPVVPITLIGTGTIMPTITGLAGPEKLREAFGDNRVRVVVHPPISEYEDADDLLLKTREVIGKTLKENGLEVGEQTG